MTLADRIVVMNQGIIEQVASPQEMYDKPKTRFVAGFIGSPSMNFVSCQLKLDNSALILDLNDGMQFKIPPERVKSYEPFTGKEMTFGIRPEHITEKKTHTISTQTDFSADVEVTEPMGMDTMVYLSINSTGVCARSAPRSVASPGQRMEFTMDMGQMHLIDSNSNQVI